MSTTNKPSEGDNQPDKSDVLSLLQSIEGMYKACQAVLNIHTQTALTLAITVEAQMVLTKIRVMKRRWQKHLPFKEACAVDFFDWGKTIGDMRQSFDFFSEDDRQGGVLSEYCPSKHYLLDLYEKLPETTSTPGHKPYYEELDIEKLIETQDSIRLQLKKQWTAYKEKFSDMIAADVDGLIGGVMQSLGGKGMAIRMACGEVLNQLAIELNDFYNMSSTVIEPERFERLAQRVIIESDYNGQKAQRAACHYVANLRNTTPKAEWKGRCDEEISASIAAVNGMKYGRRVSNYLSGKYDIQNDYAGFGRFLHSFRESISKEELYELLVQLFRIHYFREEKEAQEVARPIGRQEPPTSLVSPSHPRTEMSPQRPKLAPFFCDKLKKDAQETERFYDILHRCGNYMNHRVTAEEKKDDDGARYYARWKWNHVRVALGKLKMIDKDTHKSDFADYLSQVFPNLKASNVIRGFQRCPETADGFDSIVREVMDEFGSVNI